ncbi:iron-sulfur cluster co-chaperone protein HscB homolog [Rosa rugosa]|uniref:iron-sulfur cluster co-chaperone protein HscB homolog n=1 Tax=Rosa rugosa TaxID=74645 RepID=UPI002B406CA6|nr:iron-sulfur cluster co-chaperone protein HscB homolog [Rosa rugosa]
MSKKKLLTPLSSLLLLRRTLTSTPHFSIPHFQSRTNFSPNIEKLRPLFPLPGFDFPGKSFISSQFGDKPNSPHCWNCSAAAQTTPFLLCSSCRCIQPVDHSVDYFQIFGLERKYDSVEEHLEGKYKDWQKKLHPDLVHSKSEKEREYAAEQSARVIDAYRTLSKPLARAIYILKLEGVDIDEEETLSDLDLLSEIMEVREAVEEAPNSQALNQIQSLMQEKLKQWSNSFAEAFESRNFEEAVKAIRRMTYYERVNEEIVKRQ